MAKNKVTEGSAQGYKQDLMHVPLTFGGHTFPGMWRYMLPEGLLKLNLPKERFSTCMNCPKANHAGFLKDYKCCTYFPRVPNYSVGLAYKRTATHVWRDLFKKRLILPEGLVVTPQMWKDYLVKVGEEQFGKTRDVLCWFLDPKQGACGIYTYRNGVCSTFFCLHDHGQKSEGFWDELQTLASQVELALSQWVMQELGLDVESYFNRLDKHARRIKQLHDDKQGGWPEDVYADLWGAYYGKEWRFFDDAAALVEKHRDELWEIADQTDILEAVKYEKAAQKLVPKQHREEGTEFVEGGETVPPRSLWKALLKKHGRMWALPGELMQLNKRIQILPNQKKDAEARFYQDKAFEVRFYATLQEQRDEEESWRWFITEQEKSFLDRFASPQLLDWSFFQSIQTSAQLSDPMRFAGECVGRLVLRPAAL